MSLKKCFWYSSALLIAGLLSSATSNARYSTIASYPTIIQSGCQPVSCPPCYKNQGPLAGSGLATDGSGRRQIKVHIDSTWGNPTNTNVFNAVNGAINDWNIAQDTTCTPPAKTGYLLELDQQAPVGSRDIVITRNDNVGFCAGNSSKNLAHDRPDTIIVRGAAANIDPPNSANPVKLRRIMTHELGHSVGLDNTGATQGCDPEDIMQLAMADQLNCVIANIFPLRCICASALQAMGDWRRTPTARAKSRGLRLLV